MLKRFYPINPWFIYIFFTTIVTFLVIHSVFLIKDLRIREASRIQIFAKAMQHLQDNPTNISPETQDLILSILEENNQLPVIITNEKKQPILETGTYRNIPNDILKNPTELRNYIQEMSAQYKPFVIILANNHKQLVFYDNSRLLNNLQYYPYFIGFFILSYLLISIWILRILKKKDEGFIWAGLAKETAHQIGTPLSSMIGWIEIMRLENPNNIGITELEQDISRLKTISDRFSKIGSTPELNELNLSKTIQQNFNYLKNRISNKINFSLNNPQNEIFIPHNQILFNWAIENLVKNAVDAMKGVGNLQITLYEKNKNIYIDIKDSGAGMQKKQIRNIFRAGYSTKTRGWGLGLSLAKRVIEEYHNGEIFVAQSELGKGTTFRIKLKQ